MFPTCAKISSIRTSLKGIRGFLYSLPKLFWHAENGDAPVAEIKGCEQCSGEVSLATFFRLKPRAHSHSHSLAPFSFRNLVRHAELPPRLAFLAVTVEDVNGGDALRRAQAQPGA